MRLHTTETKELTTLGARKDRMNGGNPGHGALARKAAGWLVRFRRRSRGWTGGGEEVCSAQDRRSVGREDGDSCDLFMISPSEERHA